MFFMDERSYNLLFSVTLWEYAKIFLKNAYDFRFSGKFAIISHSFLFDTVSGSLKRDYLGGW